MPWATSTDVSEITGVTVDDEQLGRARSVIELFVGRTESETSTTNIGTAGIGWLRKAVAYQAAWMASQPGIFTTAAVSKIIQDGAHVEYRPDAQHLAPLARKALRRLGWKGTRSIYTPSSLWPGRERYYPAAEGVVGVHDFPDDPWRPL